MKHGWAVWVSLVPLLAGCAASSPPAPRPWRAVIPVEQAEPFRPDPVAWRWPCGIEDRCAFVGDRMLFAPHGAGVLRALDKGGRALWEYPLESDVVDIVVGAEGQEALVLTFKDSHWISLVDGRRLGAGPAPSAVFEKGVRHGDLTWQGEYVLRSELWFVPPVDPKAPGKSPQYFKDWLLHLNREQGVWEDLGLLLERGSGVASISRDGRTVLLNEDLTSWCRIFRDGKPYASFGAENGPRRAFYVSEDGDYVVSAGGGSVELYTAEGKWLWQRPEDGYPVVIRSDRGDLRIVLREKTGYTILDGTGATISSGDGTVSYFGHPRGGFFLERAGETLLLDLTGGTVAVYPIGSGAIRLSKDGKWALLYGPDDLLTAYPVPQ